MKIQANGITIHYEISGRKEAPVVVLSHSLSSSLIMWEPQMEALEAHFRVLRYDTRGHGLSDAPSGKYTLQMLGEDAVGLGPLGRAFHGRYDRTVPRPASRTQA